MNLSAQKIGIATLGVEMPKKDGTRRGDLDALDAVIRDRLRALMATRPGLTQSSLTELLNYESPSWISTVLAGKRHVDGLRTVMRLADIFRVPLGYLVGERLASSEDDASTMAMMGTWRELGETQRQLVLHQAMGLLELQRGGANSATPKAADPKETSHRKDQPAGGDTFSGAGRRRR